MEFGQLIEYNKRNIFRDKSRTKCGEETIPRPLQKHKNWAYIWIDCLMLYSFFTVCQVEGYILKLSLRLLFYLI